MTTLEIILIITNAITAILCGAFLRLMKESNDYLMWKNWIVNKFNRFKRRFKK